MNIDNSTSISILFILLHQVIAKISRSNTATALLSENTTTSFETKKFCALTSVNEFNRGLYTLGEYYVKSVGPLLLSEYMSISKKRISIFYLEFPHAMH